MNIFKTFVLMALMTGLMVGVGGFIGGSSFAMIMLGIGLIMNFVTYWFSDSMVLKSYNAREVTDKDAPQLYNIVAKLAKNADLPMPRVYVIDTDVPNAFATGRNPDHAAVAVTTGLMNTLDVNEISGVLGHELAHVKHRDILIGTIAAAMAGVIAMIADIVQWGAIFGTRSSDDDNGGIIGFLAAVIIAPIAATLIQLAVSRSREYDADKTGGILYSKDLTAAINRPFVPLTMSKDAPFEVSLDVDLLNTKITVSADGDFIVGNNASSVNANTLLKALNNNSETLTLPVQHPGYNTLYAETDKSKFVVVLDDADTAHIFAEICPTGDKQSEVCSLAGLMKKKTQ